MIKDITIGQYYREKSILHRLDPRVKIIGTFIYMIALFVFKDYIAYVVATLMLAIIIKVSKVPFRYIVKGLKTIVILLLFSVICQLFMVKEGSVLVNVYGIKIYEQGVINASIITIRIILLILGSSMMTFTTTPNELTNGFESVLKPLKLIKVPVHDVAMMMSIALRYIPILADEADKIMKAQIARGADFESGGLIKKAKSLIPLIVPLFVAAFKRAAELAQAMEARCYNGSDKRTKMKPLKYKTRDFVAYLVMFGFIGINIALKVLL